MDLLGIGRDNDEEEEDNTNVPRAPFHLQAPLSDTNFAFSSFHPAES